MRIAITFIIYLAVVKFSFGDTSIPAYVVLNSGDTIRGSTHPILRKENPDRVYLSTSEGASPDLYIPKSILAFHTDDDYLLSAKINLDMVYNKSIEISRNYSETVIKDTVVFLRVLVKGKLSLFMFKDINGKDHYFLNDGNGYLELVSKTVAEKANVSIKSASREGSFTYNDSRYKDQLTGLMPGFIPEKKKIQDVKFEEYDLTNLIAEYNNKTSPGSVIYTQKTYKHIAGYLLAGALVSKVKFSTPDNYSHTEAMETVSSSVGPNIGLMVPIQLRRKSNRLNLVPELLIKSTDIVEDYTNQYVQYHVHFGQVKALFNIALMTQIDTKSLSPFAGCGFMTGILLSETNEKSEHNFDPQWNPYYSRDDEGTVFHDTRSLDNGYFISTGCILKRILFLFRYEHTFTAIKENGTYNTYYAMIGYRL